MNGARLMCNFVIAMQYYTTTLSNDVISDYIALADLAAFTHFA